MSALASSYDTFRGNAAATELSLCLGNSSEEINPEMLRAGFFFVMIIASVRAFSIGGMRTVSPQPLLRSSPLTMRNGGPSKSRFGDDGTREEGIAIGDGISDKILSSPLAGFFDGFKWGTECVSSETNSGSWHLATPY